MKQVSQKNFPLRLSPHEELLFLAKNKKTMFVIFIEIAIIIAGFILYSYAWQVLNAAVPSQEKTIRFKQTLYQKIIKAADQREKSFRGAGEKVYRDPFR